MAQVFQPRRLKMHSLEQLNVYSNITLVYGDERPTSITTTPSNTLGLTSTIYSTEDITHNLVVPFTIDSAISIDATLSINVSMYSGATVSWPVQDANLTYTNPSTGIYQVSGITRLTQWIDQNHPAIYMGPDRNGNLTYTANISGVGSTISWNNNAILAATAEINTGTLSKLYYNEDEAVTFNSGLLVTDTNPLGTYSIAISKSDNIAGTLSSTGAGSASVYSANVLTIAGTKNEVNSHLAQITFTPTVGYISNFNLTYAVTNISTSQINYATQSILIGEKIDNITNMYYDRYYTISTTTDIFATNVPYISELAPDYSNYYSADAYTTLLLHLNGSTYDDSINHYTISANGSPGFSNPSIGPQFGNLALVTGPSIYNKDTTNLSSSLSEYTVEMYVYRAPGSSIQWSGKFFEVGPRSIQAFYERDGYISIWMDNTDTKINNQWNTQTTRYNSYADGTPYYGGIKLSRTQASFGQWHHVVICQENNYGLKIIRAYIDGVRVLNNQINQSDSMPKALAFGGRASQKASEPIPGAAYDKLNGWIDEIRFSNICRYFSDSISNSVSPYTIIFQFADYIGRLGISSTDTLWDTSTLTYTFSGTLAQCNQRLIDLNFYPITAGTGSTTVTYSHRRRGIFQLSETFTLGPL